jgi:hypothetical protein
MQMHGPIQSHETVPLKFNIVTKDTIQIHIKVTKWNKLIPDLQHCFGQYPNFLPVFQATSSACYKYFHSPLRSSLLHIQSPRPSLPSPLSSTKSAKNSGMGQDRFPFRHFCLVEIRWNIKCHEEGFSPSCDKSSQDRHVSTGAQTRAFAVGGEYFTKELASQLIAVYSEPVLFFVAARATFPRSASDPVRSAGPRSGQTWTVSACQKCFLNSWVLLS